MIRLGVFVDVGNLYYCIGKKYPGRKLDYSKYLEYLKDLGEFQQLVAFGTQTADEAKDFIYRLQQLGFQTKYRKTRANGRKPNWNVGIAINALNMCEKFDLVIIGSSDADLDLLIDELRNKGVGVVVFACGIGKELRRSANKWIEIPESLLEDAKTDGAILPPVCSSNDIGPTSEVADGENRT